MKFTPRQLALAIPLILAMAGSASRAEAAGVSPMAATPAQRDQAQAHFLKGKELFGASKFDQALTEFQGSYDVVASPNTHLYIARCLRELGRVAAAYTELSRTATEAKDLGAKYEKTGEAALAERADLDAKVGFVDVQLTHAEDATTVRVGTDEIKRDNWSTPVPVNPGKADVVVETPGRAPITRSIDVSAGEKKIVAIDVQPEPPPPPPPVVNNDADDKAARSKTMRTMMYVSGGVAAAGLLTFVVAGAMANGSYSDLESACGKGPCPPGHEDDISSGRTKQTIANVGLVFFGLGAAGAVTLFVLNRNSANNPPAATPAAAASVRVVASPSFVGLTGGF